MTDFSRSKHGLRIQTVAATCVCLLIVAVTVYWHSIDLGGGDLSHFDEFYTYERVLGFAANDDWFTVYSAGEPSLKKPPLQYWMSAGLIEAGFDDLTALRIPSIVFAAATLLMTAALAYVMFPRLPWMMPAALLFVATSDQFWSYATSAMLETGAAFFATLGLLTLYLSFKNPRYWPSFALAVFLAGMQKSPAPLAFLLMALIGLWATQRWHGKRLRDILDHRGFRISVVAAAIAGFLWPVFQRLRYLGPGDDRELRGSVFQEMILRFIPDSIALFSNALQQFDSLILVGEPIVRLLGFAGLTVLVFLTKRPAVVALASVAILFVIIMVLGSDSVYSRYTLMILPLLSVAAAWLVFTVLRQPAIGVAATLALAVVLGGPLRPVDVLAQSDPGRYGRPISDILGPLNTALKADETAIFCNLAPSRFPPGAVSIAVPNAGIGRPIYVGNVETIRHDMRRYTGGPVRGVCRASEVEVIAPYFPGMTVEPIVEDFVIWSATGFDAMALD